MNTHSWRVPAARAGRRRPALTALLTTVATVALCAGAAAPATAAPRRAGPAATIPTHLWSVSCPDASHCFAVGQHNHHGSGLSTAAIEQLSGGRWSPVPRPEPAKATSAQLSGVWCTTARNCLAVGTYSTAAGQSFPLGERWNGTVWSLVSVPAAGSTLAGLSSVACASEQDCWAVGGDEHGTLVEHWNGATWAIFASPGSGESFLHGVGCAGSADCWAVGDTDTGTLTLRWNGAAWTKVTTPTSGSSGDLLAGVSCAGGTMCMAVGWAGSAMLSQRWDGKSWSLSGGVPASAASGVACLGGLGCMAVGVRSTLPAQGNKTMAARWTGSAWSPLATPNPVGRLNIHGLSGIACPAVSDCWAVGGSDDTGGPGLGFRIILHWNGTAWSPAH